MLNYIFLALSVTVNVVYSSLNNYLGKNAIKKTSDNYSINTLMDIVAGFLLLVIGLVEGMTCSTFTLLYGILFGVVTAMSGLFNIKALSCGPMSFTVLLTTSSMIIPALFGSIMYKQAAPSVFQLAGIALMICAAYFSTEKDGTKKSFKWLCYCFASFLCVGSIGSMQQIQQHSDYNKETGAFLVIAFVAGALMCLLCRTFFRNAEKKKAAQEKSKQPDKSNNKKWLVPLMVVFCGLFIGFLNKVNLYLSGVLDSVLLFPIQNGGTTMLSVVVAIVVFREKINKRRIIGLVLGFAALALLIFG